MQLILILLKMKWVNLRDAWSNNNKHNNIVISENGSSGEKDRKREIEGRKWKRKVIKIAKERDE